MSFVINLFLKIYTRPMFMLPIALQDMIENVLEIKDTHVREVMTPLVDVVAIDASASLVDFHSMWVTHQYSRVPVFEQRIDNIVGIAYAMDLLDYVQKV
jgi:CBS domain containing-hemolysin-like protein